MCAHGVTQWFAKTWPNCWISWLIEISCLLTSSVETVVNNRFRLCLRPTHRDTLTTPPTKTMLDFGNSYTYRLDAGIVWPYFLRGILEMFTPDRDTLTTSTCKDCAGSREQLHWQAWCGDRSTLFSEGGIGKLLVSCCSQLFLGYKLFTTSLCRSTSCPSFSQTCHCTGVYLESTESV